jgi:hypothetical protein
MNNAKEALLRVGGRRKRILQGGICAICGALRGARAEEKYPRFYTIFGAKTISSLYRAIS